MGIHDAVVVAGRRHAAGGLVVGGKVLRELGAEGDGLGAIENRGAGLFEEPDVFVEAGAGQGGLRTPTLRRWSLYAWYMEPT